MPNSGYHALARYYDTFTTNMDYQKRTEYICALLAHWGAAPGSMLLDLACGTGVYSYALMERGYDIIGVDASVEMLGMALNKAAQLAVAPPLLLCQRLDQLDLYGTAQGAICLTDSLNHITEPAKLRRFFKRLALFLEPGSPFIFDVNTLHKQEHILADNSFVYEAPGVFCVWQNRWEPDSRTTQIDLDLFAEEQPGSFTRYSEHFAERVYTHQELTAWLTRAGFELLHTYGELTELPPKEDAQRVYYICRRK